MEINAGPDVCRMAASPDTGLLVATGGKENPLKLWDAHRADAAPVFQAKNVSKRCAHFNNVFGYPSPPPLPTGTT